MLDSRLATLLARYYRADVREGKEEEEGREEKKGEHAQAAASPPHTHTPSDSGACIHVEEGQRGRGNIIKK